MTVGVARQRGEKVAVRRRALRVPILIRPGRRHLDRPGVWPGPRLISGTGPRRCSMRMSAKMIGCVAVTGLPRRDQRARPAMADADKPARQGRRNPGRHAPSNLSLGDPCRPELGHGLEDTRCQIKYLIRDRDGKYPALFDTILADAGIEVVLSDVRMPRMNSIMERWIQACRHELLDRTLIWNQAHLLHALREYERHHNSASAAPGHRQRPAATTPARPDDRTGVPGTAPHTPTRPTRRHPPRIRTRGLTSTDNILGTRRVSELERPYERFAEWAYRLVGPQRRGGVRVPASTGLGRGACPGRWTFGRSAEAVRPDHALIERCAGLVGRVQAQGDESLA
jgi:hypothetical protein